MKIDSIDIEILRLLQDDANITNKEIAYKTGLTVTPIYERIKKLSAYGVIKKKVITLDRRKLDLGLMVLISISLDRHMKENVNQFMKDVVKNKEVVECLHLTGTFDFQLKVYAKDMDAYQNFMLNKISAIKNIGQIESHFVMTEVKNTNSLPI